MKRTVLQTVKIAVFSLLALVFIVFSVLALLPERTAVEVRSAFTASSSVLSIEDGTYQTVVSGKLRNTSSAPVMVDRVTVRLAGLADPLVTDGPILLRPRTDTDVTFRLEDGRSYDAVSAVSVTEGGEEIALRNPAVSDAFAYAFLPILLALVFLALAVHAVIVRVYMAQEKRLSGENTPENA